MPTIERQLRDIIERLDELEPRVTTAVSIAEQHGDRHTDLGGDAIQAALVAGHTHAGGATPVVEATNTSAETAITTSHTVSLPSGIVNNDLLEVVFASGGTPTTVIWPTGWTSVFKETGSDVQVEIGIREADGTEASTITVTTSASRKSAHISYRVSGARVGSTAISHEVSAGANASSGNADPDGITPTGGNKNYLWIAFAALQDGAAGAFSVAPTNYSNLLTIGSGTGVPVGVGSAERGFNSGSEDPGTFTNTSNPWAAGTIVIYPDEASLHSGEPNVHHNQAHTLTSHSTKLFDLATEDLDFVDAGSVGATQQDWVEITVGGVTGYIHVFAAK